MYLTGIALMGLFMLIIGIIGTINTDKQAIAIGVMLVIIRITFKVTLGPACYTIVAETPSSRVRGQSMVIGRAGYVAGGIIMNQLKPRMLNADGWGWGAKSGYFFLGFDIAFFIYLFFYLPETRNRTTAEIEYLFQKRVPCRKFKKYEIDREYSSVPADIQPRTSPGLSETMLWLPVSSGGRLWLTVPMLRLLRGCRCN